ncbi:MAG: hypothetical protein B1H40_04745, partial [Candidatus Latescibacteria bacterium 4484_181]
HLIVGIFVQDVTDKVGADEACPARDEESIQDMGPLSYQMHVKIKRGHHRRTLTECHLDVKRYA